MNPEHIDEKTSGRYGKSGYIFNLHNPTNPETGKEEGSLVGVIEKVL
jgi:hypothetical protein